MHLFSSAAPIIIIIIIIILFLHSTMTRIVQDSLREAAAGAFAGAVTKTAAAPLDRLKLVVQLRGSLAGGTTHHYEGPWAALRRMIQQEGVLALWRGNVSTILINCGTFALNFSEWMDVMACCVGWNDR